MKNKPIKMILMFNNHSTGLLLKSISEVDSVIGYKAYIIQLVARIRRFAYDNHWNRQAIHSESFACHVKMKGHQRRQVAKIDGVTIRRDKGEMLFL